MNDPFLCVDPFTEHDYGRDAPNDTVLLMRWIRINHDDVNDNASARESKTIKSKKKKKNKAKSESISSRRRRQTQESQHPDNMSNFTSASSIISSSSSSSRSPSSSSNRSPSFSSHQYENRLEEVERQMELLESNVALRKQMLVLGGMMVHRDEQIRDLQIQVQGLLLKQREYERDSFDREDELDYSDI